MLIRSLFVAAALAVSVSAQAQAQSLPKPAEFYFEADANATRPVVAIKGSGAATTQKLLKAIERNAYAKAEVAQYAHLEMEAGRADVGRALYQRALNRIDTGDGLWRAVVWNYGWDLYRAGDAAAALEQWRTLMTARNVTPAWLPPTLAVTLWTLGRKGEAVQWYAAAVRTEPQLWRGPARYPQLLPDWRDAERATLAEVQAAWAANPPVWP